MFETIKKIAVTAMVSIGVLATAPATAQAHHIQHGGHGGYGGAQFGIWIAPGGHSHWRRDHRRDRRWDRGHRAGRHFRGHRCGPRRALNKAYRMGVRNAHIRRVNHRVIKVAGRSHGHRVRIVFARAPGCPVIRY